MAHSLCTDVPDSHEPLCSRSEIRFLSDGQEIGVFAPGSTPGGVENTGWIDILTGITAHKRDDGGYLIFVEEDYKAKSILYRWRL